MACRDRKDMGVSRPHCEAAGLLQPRREDTAMAQPCHEAVVEARCSPATLPGWSRDVALSRNRDGCGQGRARVDNALIVTRIQLLPNPLT